MSNTPPTSAAREGMMNEKLLEAIAAKVAVATNGGTHYTVDQRRLWVERVRLWFKES